LWKLHAGLLLPASFKSFLSALHELGGKRLETDSHKGYTEGKTGSGQIFWPVQCLQDHGECSQFRNWLRDGGLLETAFGDRFSN